MEVLWRLLSILAGAEPYAALERLIRMDAATSFESVAFDHMDALFRTAKALLRNTEEAEDVVQETYLQAWKSFHRFTPGTNCRAWMFAILFNVVRHHRRKWLDRFSFGLPEGFEETAAAPQSVPEESDRRRDAHRSAASAEPACRSGATRRRPRIQLQGNPGDVGNSYRNRNVASQPGPADVARKAGGTRGLNRN